jgi:hypothetical protein
MGIIFGQSQPGTLSLNPGRFSSADVMASGPVFFGDLASARNGVTPSAARVAEAQQACRGGHPCRNLADIFAHYDRLYPASPYFNGTLTEGETPKGLAAFCVSVAGSWNLIEFFGVYVVFGHICVRNVREGKASLAKEKYRDVLAGSLQHFTNGLAFSAREAAAQQRPRLKFPCDPGEISPLAAAQLACRLQGQAVALRSEKYAAVGEKSGSSHLSYKAALEHLARCLEINAELEDDPETKKKLAALSAQIARQAAALLLKDKEICAALDAGERPDAAMGQQLTQERRLVTGIARFLGEKKSANVAARCAKCEAVAPVFRGASCGCVALCEGCVELETLMECPLCDDFTEFFRAEPH